MLIKVQISKTWQEKQFEPINISLGVEVNVPHETDKDALCKEIASELQATAQAIYDERRTFKG